MKIIKSQYINLLAITLLLIAGCKDKNQISDEAISLQDYKKETSINTGEDTGVTIVSRGMNFELPDQIKSGWQKITYENRSGDTHFLVLEKLPAGKHIEDSEKEVVPVFVDAMNLINQGDTEKGFKKFEELPEWFFNIKFLGGVGLVSPGHTAQTTLNLEPGNYLVECYVKMPDGTFHSAMGMLEEIEVLPAKTTTKEPQADNIINISTEGGIVLENVPETGQQKFKVNFLDQQAYGNFVGHDVNLVRYQSVEDLKALNDWMNWVGVDSFISPSPKNIEFLGGVQEMPEGSVAYFEADLIPGKYALVAEIPDPASNKMLATFEIGMDKL
ncbi:hypothetical protein [Gramella sp. KN1008]|uniref:hypothetical protein n=1 Tax=Gramella sp. KN1008 TaxID=2529298 RepID=UPI00103E0AC4|nr:hypothetical protein [Gramella sp. KN1008]TBW27120.1 hypothetical protein EZJ28_12480 [Gramella sp. KN1008]